MWGKGILLEIVYEKKSKYKDRLGRSDSDWICLSSTFFIKAFLLSYARKLIALKFNQQKFPDRVSVIRPTIQKRIRELCVSVRKEEHLVLSIQTNAQL